MNNDLQPKNNPVDPTVLSHDKVITPFNPDLELEEPAPLPNLPQAPDKVEAIYPAPVPQPINAHSPQPNQKSQQPVGKFNTGRYWAGKITKLLIAGSAGGLIAASYYYYLTNGNFLDRAYAASRYYSPLVLENTIITTIALILLYGLLLHFILRSKYSFGQSIFANFVCQLLVLILIIENFNEGKIGIFGGGSMTFLIISAIAGVIVFSAANYLAEKVWSWKISRLMLASSTIIILLIGTFGLSRILENNYV